jgi:hypothetical protein
MDKNKTKRKPDPPVELDPLCDAVLKIKNHTGWSLPEMARHTHLSVQTLFRFTKGLQVPRDFGVITRLRDVALAVGLINEANLFEYVLEGWQRMIPVTPIATPTPPVIVTNVSRSPEQVQLGMAMELAVSLDPAAARKAAKLIEGCVELAQQAWRETHRKNTVNDDEYYREVRFKLAELVREKVFHAGGKKKGGKK